MRTIPIALIALGASLVFSSAAFADSQSRRYSGGHSRNHSTEKLVLGAIAGTALGLAVAGKGHRGSRRGYRNSYGGHNRYGYASHDDYNQYRYGRHQNRNRNYYGGHSYRNSYGHNTYRNNGYGGYGHGGGYYSGH